MGRVILGTKQGDGPTRSVRVRPRGPDKPPTQKLSQPVHLGDSFIKRNGVHSKKGIFPYDLPPSWCRRRDTGFAQGPLAPLFQSKVVTWSPGHHSPEPWWPVVSGTLNIKIKWTWNIPLCILNKPTVYISAHKCSKGRYYHRNFLPKSPGFWDLRCSPETTQQVEESEQLRAPMPAGAALLLCGQRPHGRHVAPGRPDAPGPVHPHGWPRYRCTVPSPCRMPLGHPGGGPPRPGVSPSFSQGLNKAPTSPSSCEASPRRARSGGAWRGSGKGALSAPCPTPGARATPQFLRVAAQRGAASSWRHTKWISMFIKPWIIEEHSGAVFHLYESMSRELHSTFALLLTVYKDGANQWHPMHMQSRPSCNK